MNEEKFYMNKIKRPFNNYLMFEGRGVIFVILLQTVTKI